MGNASHDLSCRKQKDSTGDIEELIGKDRT
jgi:hypothetical protein